MSNAAEMNIIDYDRIEQWSPWISDFVLEIAPTDLLSDIQSLNPEFTNDAADFVCQRIGFERLINHLVRRLEPFRVRMYHGTRVTTEDADRIRRTGLKPLRLADRTETLAAIFQVHPRWGDVRTSFEDTLQSLGPGNAAGLREDNSVYACFSQAGLMKGCSHYLNFGAEVDGHVAHALFGDQSGHALLRSSRMPKLVTFVVPFAVAAQASNPRGVPPGELPSLLGLLLSAWAYREAHPNFTVVSQRDCTAAQFPGPIEAERLEAIIDVDDAQLDFT